jgi:hypothetical protein
MISFHTLIPGMYVRGGFPVTEGKNYAPLSTEYVQNILSGLLKSEQKENKEGKLKKKNEESRTRKGNLKYVLLSDTVLYISSIYLCV